MHRYIDTIWSGIRMMPFSGPRLRKFGGEHRGKSVYIIYTYTFNYICIIYIYIYTTYCPADFPSLQSNLSDWMRMFVGSINHWWLGSQCSNLPTCVLTSVEGLLDHDWPKGADWWSCLCLRGAGCPNGFEARNGGVDEHAECPWWKLMSKDCFPWNDHLTQSPILINMYTVCYYVYIYIYILYTYKYRNVYP